MVEDESNENFLVSLKKLQNGSIIDFLRKDGFPSWWIELVSNQILRRELAGLSNIGTDVAREQFSKSQIQALASRLILGRDTDLLVSLRPLWHAFGSSDVSCKYVQDAARTSVCDWPSEVRQRDVDCAVALRFSNAFADFIEQMRRAKQEDSEGVLGAAIMSFHILEGRPNMGFPLVLRGGQRKNLRDCVWVSPNDKSSEKPSEKLEKSWNELWDEIKKIVGLGERTDTSAPHLPNWLHQLVTVDECKIETLDSAGFAMAMQLLAQQKNRRLPFGIGFTGRWENRHLRGVHDLAVKTQAAREAGIFLLFACRDPNDPEPAPVDGVRLVLLPERLDLENVVRLVNSSCGESGFTEFLWREADNCIRSGSSESHAHTPDLPEALNGSLCPFGFVGRNRALAKLDEEKINARRHPYRRLLAVVAPPRSGKTTLLSQFATKQSPYPIWFSFRRGQAGRRTLEQLKKALNAQLTARFSVVPLPLNRPQNTDSSNSTDDELASVVNATVGHIDVVIDGIDEAHSHSDSQRILEWLQQLPGIGLVVVGTQPLPKLDSLNCKRLELQNETEGIQDAKSLIDAFASQFSRTNHLQSIASQLREQRWADVLTTKAGGNLWILTEFLSAVERDQCGWPSNPEEVRFSPDVRQYCRFLMEDALKDYSNRDELEKIETFLMFRAFLDDRNGTVQNVVQLAGRLLPSIPLSMWDGSGGLLSRSVRRVIKRNGEFHSPLTREAVRQNYQSNAPIIAGRFIELIGDQQPQDALIGYAVEWLPTLLAEIGDQNLTHCLLFKSPWLHRRMRMLANQGQPVSNLIAELNSLIQLVSPAAVSAVGQLVDWLAGWGLAIDDDPVLVDQWWQAKVKETAHDEETPSFPNAKKHSGRSTNKPRLLAPVAGKSVLEQFYDVPWPASPRFSAACEVLGCPQSRLVFATVTGELLIFREDRSGYVRERFIRLPKNEQIIELVGLTYPKVATLVRRDDHRCDLRVIDIATRDSRTLVECSNTIRLESLAANLLAVSIVCNAEQNENGPFPCILHVLDAQGRVAATVSLPFVVSLPIGMSKQAEIDVVSFGHDCWAVLGHRQPGMQREMRIYCLDAIGGEITESEGLHLHFPGITGACALPDSRLAVIHDGDDEHQSVLTVLDKSGKVSLRIPLYTTSGHDREKYSLYHATVGEFLLNCRPASWHKQYGVILYEGMPENHYLYTVCLEHEAKPQKLPHEISRILDPGDSTTERVRVLSLSTGRTLFVFSTGAVVLGLGLSEPVRIEGGLKTEVFTEIVGGRSDGQVVVCDGYVDPDNRWCRDNFRYAVPPFQTGQLLDVPTKFEKVHVTPDGWELRWRYDCGVITSRQYEGEQVFRWDATEFVGGKDLGAQILDSIGDGEGNVFVAVKYDDSIKLLRLQPKADGKPQVELDIRLGGVDGICRTSDGEIIPRMERIGGDVVGVTLRASAKHLLIYDVLLDGHGGGHVAQFILDRIRGFTRSFQSSEISLVPLVDDVLLMIFQWQFGKFKPPHCWVYFSGEDTPEKSSHPDVSTRTFVLERIGPHDGEYRIRIASINVCDRQWSVDVHTLRVDSQERLVLGIPQSFEQHVLHHGDVTAWTRCANYLVLAYASGRIEIRPFTSLGNVVAVMYTLEHPMSVVVAFRPEGTFLIVSAGGLWWYELPQELAVQSCSVQEQIIR